MSELEKKFFDTFDIKPKFCCVAYKYMEKSVADELCNDFCSDCKYNREEGYPEITDTILLDIANVLIDWTGSLLITYRDIRNEILEEAIFVSTRKDVNEFIKQVQNIFKEE